MNNFNRVLFAIRDLIKPQIEEVVSQAFHGVVETVNPLSIRISINDVLPAELLILGQACRPYKISIPHTHEYSGNVVSYIGSSGSGGDISHTHSINHGHSYSGETQSVKQEYVEINIFEPLEPGDVVLLFSFNKKQTYYVAERVVRGNGSTSS